MPGSKGCPSILTILRSLCANDSSTFFINQRSCPAYRVPSLSTIDGLGDKAADAFVEAAAQGPFLSKDDLRQRSKLSKTVIDLMADLGLLEGLPESNQLSLFDFG